MELIQSTTLTVANNTVTLSSIPQTFRDLILVVNGTKINGGGDWCRIRINNDGTSSPSVFMETDGNSQRSNNNSTSGLTDTYWNVTWLAGQTSRTAVTWHFFDYTQTNKGKHILVRSNRPDGMMALGTGRWPNTAAITSLVCQLGDPAAQFAVGTTFTLYGLAG